MATKIDITQIDSSEFGRAWDSELLFDKNVIEYDLHVQDAAIEFTIAPVGNLVTNESSIVQRIQADGVNTFTFSGFSHIGNIANGEVLEAGTYAFFFLWINGIAYANLLLPSSEEANLSPLMTPANFTATRDAVNGDTEIDLAWDTVADVSSYEIYSSTTGSSGPWSLIAEPGAGDTTFAHTGLIAATTYYYRMRAIDGGLFANSQYAVISETTEDPADVTAPVATFFPADAATDVPVNQVIVFDFDEPIIDDDGTTVITNANVADYLALKETDGSGTDIPFTATINGAKTQIIIVSTNSMGQNQDVYAAVDGIEDFNGNEAALQTATFTTGEFAAFNGTSNFLDFGDILDSLFTAANTYFELEFKIKDYLITNYRQFITKDGDGIQRCFLLYSQGPDVYFGYYMTAANVRYIKWANALDGDQDTLTLIYDGSIDTNDGLDRVVLEIDGTPAGSKTIYGTFGALDDTLHTTTAHLAVAMRVNTSGTPQSGAFFSGEAKDFIVRSAGAVVEINVPDLRTGEDISGNNRDGTWV